MSQLDALRSQYESQLSSLQAQLEDERRHNLHSMEESQKSYEEFMSTFRQKLDPDENALLDELIAKLTKVHEGRIQEVEDKHKHDVTLEVMAVKTSLEQLYMSKSQLEVSAALAEHEERLKEMREGLEKKYKEKVNKMMAEQQKGNLDSSLTDKYNKLIQDISQALDDKILTQSESSSDKASDDDKEQAGTLSQEIRHLLMNQKEEIATLRSQLLGDYESMLQSRTQSMKEQAQEVADLEEQLKSLQSQYSEQVASFQEMLTARDDEQKKQYDEEKIKVEQHQSEMKSHYEKRVQDMEASFEKEINCIKEKYEDHISGLVQARLELHTDSKDIDDQDLTVQTAGVDTDSDNTDTPRSSATDTALRIKELEKELQERDSQIKELKVCLDHNDGDVDEFKNKIEELEEELSNVKSMCTQLEELVAENKNVIETLEQEKKESEKLYKDLLEKESPRSKGSAVRGYLSSDSVDDSFCSARDEIQDTPRSLSSLDSARETTSSSQNTIMDDSSQTNEEDKDDEHNSTIPFAQDSGEYTIKNLENCNNNSNNYNSSKDNSNNNCLPSSSSSLEEQVANLKEEVEDLIKQLEEVKALEKNLQGLLDESEHHNQEMMENLRQELEHEKQMEVETLQSEFKVQLEIELKRQAAELTQSQESTPTSSSSSITPIEQQTQTELHFDADISDRLFSTLETADDSILEASNSNMLLQTAKFELQTVVMAGVKTEDDTEENLSDDSKVTSTLSPVSSPTHTSPIVTITAPVTQSLPLTDMEKEVQAMKEEYESKVSHLSSEIERMNEEKESLIASHQQRMKELEGQVNETEARYDRLMEGVQSGDHPDLNELMKDKYDQELDLAQSLMQKDFDETLTAEKKKFMEHHRKLMSGFMEDKDKVDEEAHKKHEQELEELKERLAAEFETRVQGYEQEIERLNRDLDLLRTPRGSDEGTHDGTLDGTLPEIEEITLQLQHEVESASPSSEKSSETSSSLKSSALSYEESEEETGAERNPTLQIRSFSDVVEAPSPSPALLKEKEELEMKVQQLVSQVERLTQQLAERQDSSPVSPLHSPHNTTLKAEDPALITMLQSDLDRLSTERESVQATNDRLLSLLSDSVKTYIGVEDTINRKLTQVVSGTPRSQSQSQGDSGDVSRSASVELGLRHGTESQGSRQGSPAGDYLKGASPDVDTSQDSHAMDNTSILSNATDEGLEISQRLAESIFVGPDLDAEGEEILSDARGRLTSAVDQLLGLMEQSTMQLHEAKNTQEELLATLSSRAREVESSQSRGSELNSQLASEIEAKEYLGLELHKAEGLIAGYAADREANEKQIQTLEEEREALIVELDSTRIRLEVFQRSQAEIDATREDLVHQQNLLKDNVGQETQALLNEVSNLNQERRDLAIQLQHQLDLSRKRLSEMEALAEEAERKHETVVEEKNQALDDMHLQLDNTERQLKSSKAFVDELLVEREQEREEHQREVEKMKETIEGKDRSASSQERLQREISDLTEQLQARITTQSSMHQRIVDLQKVLDDKELNTNDLKVWVSQLEGELDQKFSEEDQLKDRISKLERQLTEKSESPDEEAETDTKVTTSPRSEGEKEEMVVELSQTLTIPMLSVVSLEEELQKSKETKEELDQENNTLKQQLHDQMLQISGLKNQIDQMRHYATADDSDAAQLRERLAQERDQMEQKEAEIAEAERKIEHLESVINTKNLEAEEMNSRVSKILVMGDTQEENSRLKSDLEEMKSQLSEMSVTTSSHQLSMPVSLLEEKNEEISELKARLQIIEKDVMEKADQMTEHQEKVLQLQQQVKNRDEEIVDLQDSLASARRGEACLDMSLPMPDDGVAMLNMSMTGRTSRSSRAVTPTSIQQEFEDTIAQREGEMQSLELRVAALKKELEEANDEQNKIKEKLVEKEEVDEKYKTELMEKDEEIEKLQQELLVVAKDNDELKANLQNVKTEEQNQTDQQKIVESLEDAIQQKDNDIYQMTLEIEELKGQVDEAVQATDAMEKVIEEKDAELTKVQEERDEKRDQLQEKEHKLDQTIIQIDGLQAEISGLTNFQTELQKDYDTIQSMLDEKEKVLETLTHELTDTKADQDVLDSMGNIKEDLDSTEVKLKNAEIDLESEKQASSELRELLSKEEANVETFKLQLKKISEEINSLKEKFNQTQKAVEDRESVIEKQTESQKILENEQEISKEKIAALEKAMKDEKEQVENETKLLITECDKIREEYDAKVKDLEEQLQEQDAKYLAMRLASCNVSQSQELDSSKHQSEKEKDVMLEDLKRQLKELEEQRHESTESLKLQLESRNKELEEFVTVKRQLKEMDEQLRYRQNVLLETQAENERLTKQLEESNCVDEVRIQLEEKDQQLNELEGQLRFRQYALLEMESEKENLVEEKALLEQQLRKELNEKEPQELKENELQELKEKYASLEEELQELKEENQLQEWKEKYASLEEEFQELKEKKKELQELKEKFDSLEKELQELKEKELQELKEKEVQELKEKEKELQELKEEELLELKEKEKELQELKENYAILEKQLHELQEKYASLKDGINEEVLHMEQEMQKSSQARVIKTLPACENQTEEVEELKEKLLRTAEEFDTVKSKLEERDTELSRKNNELEVRQNTIHDLLEEIESMQIDRAVVEAKDNELRKLQEMMKEAEEKASLEAKNAEKLREELLETERKATDVKEKEEVCEEGFVSQTNASVTLSMPPSSPICDEENSIQATLQMENNQLSQALDVRHEEIQEKKKNIKELSGEIESLKSQLEDQDQVILTLKDELEISKATHQEQLLSRDGQISQLQETVRGLKPQSSLDKVQISEGDNVLSPQTKQQISQLKSQLRKAHSALEEMQANGGTKTKEVEEDSVDGGRFTHLEELETLRNIVQEQEEELAKLKSQNNGGIGAAQEEKMQAETTTVTKSGRTFMYEKEIDAIREDVQNCSQNKTSTSYNADNMTFGSFMGGPDNVPHRIQALLDRLRGLGEDLLSASDFEYLQRHLFQRPDDGEDSSAWNKERAALMDTIVAVKDLLQQADRLAAKSVEELFETGDWRGNLLDSLIQVYQSERQVLREEVGRMNYMYPEMDIVMQLESRIHDLEQTHQRGLDEMLKADRQSLLDEVDNLHHRLLEAKAQLQDTRHTLDQRIAELEKAKTNAEWKLQRQIQMLEYKIQQEGVIQEDLKKSLSLERQRVSELSSQSSQERSKTLELQSDLSSAQIQLSKVRDALEREQHRFNSVTDALEEEQAKTVHLTDLLDSTKKKLKNLKEELDHSESRHQETFDSESNLMKELRQELERERQKRYEFSQGEEDAQNKIGQLSEKVDNLKKKLASTKEDYEAEIERLHREWMEREVQERKARESETVNKLTDLLDVERESHREALENERLSSRAMKDGLEQIKNENVKLLHMYEVEKSQADKLKKEMDSNMASNDMLRHLRNTEIEANHLQQKVLELEDELSRVQERAAALEAELSRGQEERLHNGQQSNGEYHRDAISSLMTATYIDEELKVRLAQCCTRLQMIASKLQNMTGQAGHRGGGRNEGVDEDNSGTTGLRIVMEELEKLKANIREREEKRQNATEKDRSHQADQLLQHNKQLAEHVKKLKMEKEDQANVLKKMEEQLKTSERKSKMMLPQYISDVTSDEEGVYDRTLWASEKLSLQMSLDSAEHEIQRLRAELRRFGSVTKADGQLLKLDPDKTQRLYGKYLRAESFRKALIYQKKYLLLLLGGYRDTEQETLAILASMGGFPSPRTKMNQRPTHTRPLSTFRSVGRAVIAIFRMKYLVRKWKRATRVGSPVMMGQITPQHAYVPTSLSSYTLPNYRQQQSSPHVNHHLPSSSSSSSPSSRPVTSAVAINSRVSSDYVESLTNGGLSSTLSNYGSNNAQIWTDSPANRSHQVPSHPHHHPHQQQQTQNRNYNTTPPTKDSSKQLQNHKATRENRDRVRRPLLQDSATTDYNSPSNLRMNGRSAAATADSDDENFMRYLENVQQQLSEGTSSSRRVTWR